MPAKIGAMSSKLPLPNVPTPKLWQRQLNETSAAFEAFVLYRDMAPARSTRRVAEVLDKSKSQIDAWSSANHWVSRCQIWDNEIDKRSTNAQIAEIKAMKRRQARMAFEMQSAAQIALEALKQRLEDAKKKAEESGKATKLIMSPENIVRLADIGARLERLNYDEPDSITKVQESDFSNLSVDEMLQLRKLLEKSQGVEAIAD